MGRTLIGIVLVLAVFAGFGTLGWHFVGEKVRNDPKNRLSADKIIIVTPPPDWIPDRFTEEVLLNTGLNGTYLLDKILPQKLAKAFADHPWVAKVEQVVLRYSGAEVKLSYRMPAALVEVPRLGLFPVDASGVLLPKEYLSDTIDDRRSEHFIIQGIQSTPPGLEGTHWGDALVQTGAQLAAELSESDIAQIIKSARILPAMEVTPGGTKFVCRLKTAGGTEIIWGAFVPNDPKREAKIKKLWNLHEQYRSLDNIPVQFRPIDLSKE